MAGIVDLRSTYESREQHDPRRAGCAIRSRRAFRFGNRAQGRESRTDCRTEGAAGIGNQSMTIILEILVRKARARNYYNRKAMP